MSGGPLSAQRLNPVLADVEAWARETYDALMADYYEGGHSIGTERASRAERYDTLVRLRDIGDPRYWNNIEAQRELERLTRVFGPVPPIRVPDEQAPGMAAGPPLAPGGSLLQFGGGLTP